MSLEWRYIEEYNGCIVKYDLNGGEEPEVLEGEKIYKGYAYILDGKIVTKSNDTEYSEGVEKHTVLSRDPEVHQLLMMKHDVFDFSEVGLDLDRIKFPDPPHHSDQTLILGEIDKIPYEAIEKANTEFVIDAPDDRDSVEEIVRQLSEISDVEIKDINGQLHFRCTH